MDGQVTQQQHPLPPAQVLQKELDLTNQVLALERAAFARERALLQEQVKLTAQIGQGVGRGQGKIGCFWDYENCSPSLQTNATRLIQVLRAALQQHGPIAFIRIYQDVASQPAFAAGLRAGLEANGVEVRDCGRWGRKDVADHHVMADIAAFALDHPPPATICLMSGDKDFSYLLSIMRNRGYDVLLFENQMGAAEALKASANLGTFRFRDLIKEAGTSVDPTGTSVNAPPAVPSPSKAALTYTPQASRHRSNSDPLSPSFLPPAEGTSTSSLAKSAKQSSTNPFTLATKPKPPTYPSSFSTPVAGKKVAPRYQNLVDVLQGLPKARPLRSYVVPLLSREKWGKDVIVKDFLADAVQAGIIEAGKGEQLGMEWIGLTESYRIRTAPTAAATPKRPSSPVKPTSVRPSSVTVAAAEDRKLTILDRVATSTTVKDTPSAAAPKNGRTNSYGLLDEEAMQDDSPPSSPISSAPSSLPPIAARPQTPSVLKSFVPLPSAVSSASNSELKNTPARKYALNKLLDDDPDPATVLKLFQPLISLLNTLPAKPAPLRFIVSNLLRASHPEIYELYGWKSYATRAEDHGFVDLGTRANRNGKGLSEVIGLRDRFRETKERMIVISGEDIKPPPYDPKTASLFAPLIQALNKLPPARAANKTPATYCHKMAATLASQGTGFLEDVGVNLVSDYFVLAKRMGVIRMGDGKDGTAATEWLALRRDYQVDPAAPKAQDKPSSSTPTPAPARILTPPQAKETPKVGEKQAAPPAPAKSPLAQSTVKPEQPKPAPPHPHAPDPPSPRLTAPLPTRAAVPAVDKSILRNGSTSTVPTSAAVPTPASTRAPAPVADDSIFRSLERKLDLSLKLSDSESD